jgi:hypothetical protein
VAKKSRHCLEALTSRLDTVERTRRRIEQLVVADTIGIRDAELVYEALFLRSVVYFESLIQELFMGLLTKAVKHASPAISPRISQISNTGVRLIVFGDKDYIDWLPFTRTEKLASRYFARGLPFTLLDDNTRQRLGQIVTIRNAIAHRSDFARRQFREKVIGSTPLPPKEKTPAGYLRGIFRIAPKQTRFELFQIVLRDGASGMCT